MSDRIYKVETPEKTHLVRTANQSSARSFVVKKTIKVSVATQEDLVTLTKEGIEVEEVA